MKTLIIMDEYILPSVFGILVAVALWMASRLLRREVRLGFELKPVFDEDLVPIYTPKESGPITRGQVLSREPIIPDAPEPEVPEAVKDLLVKHINSEGALNGPEHKASDARYAHNAAVLEAYRRGQKNPV
jgi:hypothetical protein